MGLNDDLCTFLHCKAVLGMGMCVCVCVYWCVCVCVYRCVCVCVCACEWVTSGVMSVSTTWLPWTMVETTSKHGRPPNTPSKVVVKCCRHPGPPDPYRGEWHVINAVNTECTPPRYSYSLLERVTLCLMPHPILFFSYWRGFCCVLCHTQSFSFLLERVMSCFMPHLIPFS